MKQGLSLRVSQHLALTPQLQQSIRLLQLSTLELTQEVEQMLDDNPFLEVTQDEAVREEFGGVQADTPAMDDERDGEFAGDYVNGAGDAASADAESAQPAELVHRFTVALSLLHHLDPPGVGARSLAECLTLQLKTLQASSAEPAGCTAALRICRQPMDLLARRDVKRLVQLCGETEAQVKAGIGLITRLEPKPGRRFIDVERNVVVPDVLVTKVSRGAQMRFRVQLNPDV